MIREIAGRQNHTVKLARKLLKKKHRRERGLLVGEGMDLLRAAGEAGADVRDILVRSDLVQQLPPRLLQLAAGPTGSGPEVGICSSETLEYASALGGGVDVIFISREPSADLAGVAFEGSFAFFLDGVGDPGNVGTLVRSVLAFGGSGVICSPGTADPFGPKAMRAGMGAQFLVPVVPEVSAADLAARLAAMLDRGEPVPDVWVADAQEGEDIEALNCETGVIIVLGEELAGARSGLEQARRITIRQERFDSLNVAMAGTILAYELRHRCRVAAGRPAARPSAVAKSKGVR